MNEKKWFITTIIGTSIILALIAGIMIFIDPYFHFHGPVDGISYRLGNQRYINNGLERSYTYDSMIAGTSMTENFKTSEFDELFGVTSIKIPFAGAGFKEVGENIENCFKYNDNITEILWALDYGNLNQEWDYSKYSENEYPSYLYDDNMVNDIQYLLNKEAVIKGLLPDVIYTLLGIESTSMDDYSMLVAETGAEAVLSGYDRPESREEVSGLSTSEKLVVTENITKNVLSVINAHPDTIFYLYYTPYSIVEWDYYVRTGNLTGQLEAEKMTTELLLQCPNVELYCFFDEYELICDLDKYRDIKHYTTEINTDILNWIHSGEHRVTLDNYEEHLEEHYEFYSSYDYDEMY